MYYRFLYFVILIVFYGFYLFKLFYLKKQSIKVNQAGIGKKKKSVIIVERIMGISNSLEIVAQVLSIIFVNYVNNIYLSILAIIFGLVSIVFFASATITMKNNWRVGIPEEKTNLVNNGIYKTSRNPAFVGFDLLYISTTIMFFNIPLLIVSVWSIVMLHLQILQEEKHMIKMFDKEYKDYMEHTLRYIGKI